MGCRNSRKAQPVRVIANRRIDIAEVYEAADLPLKAIEDDLDLQNVVELYIRCANIQIQERVSVYDKQAVLYILNSKQQWNELGRTEVQRRTRNPTFLHSFRVTYCFESPLKCKIELYALTDPSEPQLHKQLFIGDVICNIHEVVCAPNRTFCRELYNKSKPGQVPGTISISAEDTARLSHIITMTWVLENSFANGNVYLVFYRCGEHTLPVLESSVKSRRSLEWTVEVSLNKLCLGDYNREIKVALVKSESKSNKKILGTGSFRFKDIDESPGFIVQLEQNSLNIGDLVLKSMSISEKFTFLDYVFGGCEISLIIGIDFTKSNGVPTLPSSYHHMDEDSPNQYIQAISAVGSILQYYDSDKKIPVFGFGAKLPPDHEHTSHCFALNGDIFDPEVSGIEEVIEVYQKTVPQIQLFGPTVFSDVINTAVAYASVNEATQENQQFFILLLLTDGIINDVQDTIDSITVASDFPISIIIIGIGDENFTTMKILDADENPLFSKLHNRSPSRDIVQFVEFSKHRGNGLELAKEVLFEIPSQVLEFMKTQQITPKNVANSSVKQKTTFSMKKPIVHSHTASMLSDGLKENFIKEIRTLGYSSKSIRELLETGIYCTDSEYVLGLLSKATKPNRNLKSAIKHSTVKKPSVQVQFEHNDQVCLMCDNSVDTVFEDCGHRVTCKGCIEAVGANCPACGSRIRGWRIMN